MTRREFGLGSHTYLEGLKHVTGWHHFCDILEVLYPNYGSKNALEISFHITVSLTLILETTNLAIKSGHRIRIRLISGNHAA